MFSSCPSYPLQLQTLIKVEVYFFSLEFLNDLCKVVSLNVQQISAIIKK